jgi:integrase
VRLQAESFSVSAPKNGLEVAMSETTPRKRHVPKYRHHKPSNRAVVWIDGRDYWLGRYGSPESHEKYARLIQEWKASGYLAPPSKSKAPADLLVMELLARFWLHCEAFYRRPDGTPSGEAENFRQVLKPLKELYGSTPARDFGPKKLKAVREWMITTGWTRSHINKQIARVKHVFKWSVSEELLPPTVHQALATVPGLRKGKSEAKESKRVRPVPEALIAAVRPHLSSVLNALIDVQLVTGMRPGEACAMRRCDIDTTGADVWVYRPEHHKTEHHDQVREIWLGPKARSILEPLLKPDLTAHLFSPRDSEAERYAATKSHRRPDQAANERRSGRRMGTCYDVAAYRRAIARACDDAFPPPPHLVRLKVPGIKGKKPAPRWETRREWRARLGPEKWAELCRWQSAHRWHPHQLRHNAATRLRKEFGLEVARIILGHTSDVTTLIYAERDAAKARDVMKLVG